MTPTVGCVLCMATLLCALSYIYAQASSGAECSCIVHIQQTRNTWRRAAIFARKVQRKHIHDTMLCVTQHTAMKTECVVRFTSNYTGRCHSVFKTHAPTICDRRHVLPAFVHSTLLVYCSLWVVNSIRGLYI